MIVLLIGISGHSRAEELPQTDSVLTIGLQDTTQIGALLLRTQLDWYFSYEDPEVIRDGISLSDRIPVNIEDFREIKESDEWNNYGWFEAVMVADSTLAGVPFQLSVQNHGPARVWLNGKLVLQTGNPSRNAEEEVLSRWHNPLFAGITFREGNNYFLIEYSEHTVPIGFSWYDRFENGLHLATLAVTERHQRTQRGIVFGGVLMLLTLLILLHFYLGLTFKRSYHTYVLLTSFFLLIHAITIYSDTLIDWTFRYLIFFDLVYSNAFVVVIYFYLISIRTFYALDVPWKTLTSGMVIIVVLSTVSVLNSLGLTNYINAIVVFITIAYGSYSLIEAKKLSSENRILSIATGFIVTLIGALLHTLFYLALGIHSTTLLLLSGLLAYAGLPVSLTFNVAQSYSELFRTLDEKVKERTAQLEASNQYKTKFFTNISHEFRTPLTISEGLVSKVITLVKDNAIVQRELPVVTRNLNRLHNMVDQIIDLTKSDESEITLNNKIYKADDLVSISVESYRSLADDSNITFAFYPDGNEALVSADRDKMEIMVNNLISNAIKFSPKNASVTIRTKRSLGEYIVSVKDTGPGIPEGEEESIFERFHRINRADEDYVEGMGVGLELSRTLARLHEGDIALVPNQEKGAHFKLRLPLVHVDEIQDGSRLPLVDADDTQDGSRLSLVDADETQDGSLPETSENYGSRKSGVPLLASKSSPSSVTLNEDVLPESSNQQNKKEYRILLVEDNNDMARYVSEILAELGEVHRAANGLEALEMLKSFSPDIIITDLMMPKMGGQQLVENLATHKVWKHIPVIVLSAKIMEEDKLSLLRIGVVDYITKPFKPDQLLLKTRNLLSFYVQRIKLSMEVSDEEREQIDGLKEKVAVFITQNITDSNLSVDTLAREFNQSRRSFYRNVQIETGMTPAQFIREVRLTVAQNLVHGKEKMNLDELAISVGYKSSSGFKRAYKQRFGEYL
ncbi:MAG: response regulator [Balneolales bacterium]|nr:response regulator [Balneolales bacterium]